LEKQLELIRKNGYAVDEEELTEGVRCIAAPIYSHNGEVINCLGISGPATRMKVKYTAEYANKVKKVADLISERQGYRM